MRVPGNAYNHFSLVQGDIEKAFAQADFVIEREFEPRALRAGAARAARHARRMGRAEQEVTVFGCPIRRRICSAPASPRCSASRRSSVRVVSPDVGGGFGVKLGVYPEDVVGGRGQRGSSDGP